MTKNFFYFMHTVFLVLVFLGFAPSFYLKFLIADQPFYPNGLPTPHIIHGIILTVWYIFLVVQARWIAVRNISLHKKMGWFGAAWAALVLLSTVYTISIFPERMVALAQQLNSTVEETEPGLVAILWLDVFMSVLFVLFLMLAILKRKKPDTHKRLMFYTGLVFIFAATNRIAGSIAQLTESNISLVTGPVILLVLSASILVYDYKTRKKILAVSWWCFGLYWLAIATSLIVAGMPFGASILNI